MKILRFIIPFLVLALIFCFTPSCTRTEPEVVEPVEEESAAEEPIEPVEEEVVEPEAEKGIVEAEEQSIEVDKGIFSVEITLPASLFEGEDIDEVIAEAKEDGVSDVTVHDDGSLTYKMSKSKHNEMMREMKDDLIEYIEETKNSEDYRSIKDITYNKVFSEFTLVVDQEAFGNSFDGFAALGLGILGLYYQLFDGVAPDDYEVTVFIENANTGEVFDTIIYPDDLEQ